RCAGDRQVCLTHAFRSERHRRCAAVRFNADYLKSVDFRLNRVRTFWIKRARFAIGTVLPYASCADTRTTNVRPTGTVMVPASTRVPSRSRITPVGGPGSTESAACRSRESTVAVTRAGPAWLPRVTSTRAIPVESVATLSLSTSALTARNATTFPTKGLPRLERT